MESHWAAEAELIWRQIYGRAFVGCPKLRRGLNAEITFTQTSCDRYIIVAFTSGVEGLPVEVGSRWRIGNLWRWEMTDSYECRGPLITFAAYNNWEFFVCPADFTWTMVYTHEDYGWYGGPFFVREEWVYQRA